MNSPSGRWLCLCGCVKPVSVRQFDGFHPAHGARSTGCNKTSDCKSAAKRLDVATRPVRFRGRGFSNPQLQTTFQGVSAMKTMTVYVSPDGRRFDSIDRCQTYERYLFRAAAVMSSLPSTNLRSDEYIQHDLVSLSAAKRSIVDLCRELYPNEKVFKHDAMEIHPMSFAGRFISENDSPLNDAWSRFCRINWDNCREYQQPYFAMNPHEANKKVM